MKSCGEIEILKLFMRYAYASGHKLTLIMLFLSSYGRYPLICLIPNNNSPFFTKLRLNIDNAYFSNHFKHMYSKQWTPHLHQEQMMVKIRFVSIDEIWRRLEVPPTWMNNQSWHDNIHNIGIIYSTTSIKLCKRMRLICNLWFVCGVFFFCHESHLCRRF